MYSAHYKLCGLLITINELVMAVYLTLYVLMDFSFLLMQIFGDGYLFITEVIVLFPNVKLYFFL